MNTGNEYCTIKFMYFPETLQKKQSHNASHKVAIVTHYQAYIAEDLCVFFAR